MGPNSLPHPPVSVCRFPRRLIILLSREQVPSTEACAVGWFLFLLINVKASFYLLNKNLCALPHVAETSSFSV